jgi:hypothetical protein
VGTRCRVSYLDSRNIEHAVDVTADSLFEAAAVAIRAFREGALVEELPVAGTELRIAVFSAAGRAQSSLTTGGTVGSNRYGEKPCGDAAAGACTRVVRARERNCQVSRAVLNDCQGIEPPSSGISIVLSFTASPIHSKNSSLLPTIAIGRYPSPSNG